MNVANKGVVAALLSNVLFAIIYLYSDWMKPLSGSDVFAWRMLGMFFALWLLLIINRGPRQFFHILHRVHRQKKWHWLLGTSAIIASQFWLFMWGPVNGFGLDIAVGYFLFPLVMVLAGRVFFLERLNWLQWLAIALAALGIAINLWQNYSFSWATTWIIVTYPIYYLTRRLMRIPALPGLVIDLTLIAPFAVLYLWFNNQFMLPEPSGKYWLLIPTLGILSAIAMQCNLYAAYSLPTALFGMFSYLEPTLLFLVSVIVLDALVPATAIWTYSLIGSGIVIMMINNYLALQKRKKTIYLI